MRITTLYVEEQRHAVRLSLSQCPLLSVLSSASSSGGAVWRNASLQLITNCSAPPLFAENQNSDPDDVSNVLTGGQLERMIGSIDDRDQSSPAETSGESSEIWS